MSVTSDGSADFGLPASDFRVEDWRDSYRAVFVAVAPACAPACLRVKESGFPGDFDCS